MQSFEAFCWRLSAAIKTSGLTRAGLAARLGVKPATIKSWCVGRRSPTVERLLELCDALGTDASELFAAPPVPLVRTECPVCGRSFGRDVGYRIHLALRAREDAGHRRLQEELGAEPVGAPPLGAEAPAREPEPEPERIGA